jgi:hypothetical protein
LRFFGLEFDGALAVGVVVGFVHGVHGPSVSPAIGTVAGRSR